MRFLAQNCITASSILQPILCMAIKTIFRKPGNRDWLVSHCSHRSLFMWCRKIYSADIKSVLNKERLMETINKFIEYHNNGSLVKFLPAYQSDKINNISALLVENKNLNELLAQLNIELLIGDITKIDIQQLPKIDLINSNNTFEHIPPQVINAILQYFHKIIIADGVMSHFIDMSDHFAHLDKSISAYNF